MTKAIRPKPRHAITLARAQELSKISSAEIARMIDDGRLDESERAFVFGYGRTMCARCFAQATLAILIKGHGLCPLCVVGERKP